MSNNNAVGSRVLLSAFFSVLISLSGLSSCSGGGGGGGSSPPAITASLTPSRTSGVAPLAVFFDATGTTAPSTSKPFHDLQYTWSFGDAAGTVNGSKTWSTGSQTAVATCSPPFNGCRNNATGPVAAHVFENTGTFTVTLTVTDGTNTTSTTQKITVSAFTGTTYCIHNSTIFDSGVCKGLEHATTGDFSMDIANAIAAGATQILFKRGDIFAESTAAAIAKNGPGIVGTYGTGARPIVQMTGSASMLKLSSATTPTIGDWRIMDLEFDGMSSASSAGIVGAGGMNEVTMLRLYIHDTHGGITLSSTALNFLNNNGNPGHSVWDQMFIVDSDIYRMIGGAGANGLGVAGKRFAVLGNLLDDSTSGEHIMRAYYLNKGVISNNSLSNQALSKGLIKLHSATWCDASSPANFCYTFVTNPSLTTYSYLTDTLPLGVEGADGGYTQQVVISDNKFTPNSADVGWDVIPGPQNAQSDERIRNVILERNIFLGSSTQIAAVNASAVDVTIRNNVCKDHLRCFNFSMRGTGSPEPPPTDNVVYNNTGYISTANSFSVVLVGAGAVNTIIKNNLGYAPLGTGTPTVVSDSGTGTVGAAGTFGNSTNAQVLTDPNFASASPSNPIDFVTGTGSYAINNGSSAPVLSDFFLNPRPQSGVTGIDMGAFEAP